MNNTKQTRDKIFVGAAKITIGKRFFAICIIVNVKIVTILIVVIFQLYSVFEF